MERECLRSSGSSQNFGIWPIHQVTCNSARRRFWRSSDLFSTSPRPSAEPAPFIAAPACCCSTCCINSAFVYVVDMLTMSFKHTPLLSYTTFCEQHVPFVFRNIFIIVSFSPSLFSAEQCKEILDKKVIAVTCWCAVKRQYSSIALGCPGLVASSDIFRGLPTAIHPHFEDVDPASADLGPTSAKASSAWTLSLLKCSLEILKNK